MFFRRTRSCVFASALVCGLALAQQQTGTQQQQQTGQQGVQQTQPSDQMSRHGQKAKEDFQRSSSQMGSERANFSYLGVDILDHTAKAREAIKNNDKQMALSSVQSALSSCQRASEIAQSRNYGNTIPIFREFGTEVVIGPIQTAQAGLREEQPLTDEERAAAGQPVVRDVEAQYSDLSFDLDMARQHLQAAESALTANDMSKADAALAAVQQGVQVKTAEADLPLVKARANLALAHDLIRQNQYDQARAPLQEAANSLKSYTGPQSQQVSSLYNEINSFLASYDQNRAQASTQVQRWWERTAELTTPSAQQQPTPSTDELQQQMERERQRQMQQPGVPEQPSIPEQQQSVPPQTYPQGS